MFVYRGGGREDLDKFVYAKRNIYSERSFVKTEKKKNNTIIKCYRVNPECVNYTRSGQGV